MSAAQLPPPENNPGRSAQLLQPLQNRVPMFVFVAGVRLVVGAIGHMMPVAT